MKRIITIAFLLLPVLMACTDESGRGSQSATSVVLSRDNVNLSVGETVTLTATVLPESLGMGVRWSVLDNTYADVNDGVVTAKAEGVTYVVATSADGLKKAACMVNVNPPMRYSVSVKDEQGRVLSGVWGYPGLQMKLSAVTSDGESHLFTWSLESGDAGAITSDGLLTLAAFPSTDAAYAYDAQTVLKVVTEDGCGCKIPVRSSLLNGVRISGLYTPAGSPAIVQESGSYPLEILYEGQLLPATVPADGIDLELSNNNYFNLTKAGDAYLIQTGAAQGVSTRLYASLPGSAEKIQLAQIKIDKVYGITAQAAGASSSTLSFTWTKGVSVEDDIAAPYTVSLYKDEDCTDLEVSFSIPAGNGCWDGEQPRFVFSGLAPGTEYWFRVAQTDDPDNIDSPVIPVTTEAFDNIMVSDSPASAGDIILAEDFGQMCWGADELTEAAGYDVATSSVADNADTKESFTSRNAAVFVKTTGQYAQRILTAQSVARKESGFRLAKWAQGQYARIYVGPGYLFLSTKSYGTHIITPELKNIPEGMLAKLKITVHAAGKVSGGKAAFAVQRGISFSEISFGSTQTNKNKLDLTSNVETITFNGGITSLEKFEVTLEGVVRGDRIAFGPTTETAKDNNNMMLISDMTIQILELQ